MSRILPALSIVIALLAACSGAEEPGFRPRRDRDHEPSAEDDGTPRAVDDHGGHDDEVARPTPSDPPPPPTPPPSAALPEGVDPALADPTRWTERAPDTFTVELATTEGPILIDVTRAWAPNGADRFYNMVRSGLLTDVAFFRVVDGFMAQGGLPGIPALAGVWNRANIEDDPPTQSNLPGMVSFAAGGRPNTRATQFFINLVDNSRLDGMGFAPFGRVRDMTAVGRLFSGYGDAPPGGRGPSQARIVREGNAYLRAEFPDLDYIERARIMP